MPRILPTKLPEHNDERGRGHRTQLRQLCESSLPLNRRASFRTQAIMGGARRVQRVKFAVLFLFPLSGCKTESTQQQPASIEAKVAKMDEIPIPPNGSLTIERNNSDEPKALLFLRAYAIADANGRYIVQENLRIDERVWITLLEPSGAQMPPRQPERTGTFTVDGEPAAGVGDKLGLDTASGFTMNVEVAGQRTLYIKVPGKGDRKLFTNRWHVKYEVGWTDEQIRQNSSVEVIPPTWDPPPGEIILYDDSGSQ